MNIDKRLKGNHLEDDNLEKVSGGFTATEGYSVGAEIKCPNCGNADKHLFEFDMVGTQECDYFRCLNCGQQFYRYLDGTIENDI
ncbi:MAG: hypothetical protein IJU93_01600 [Lachnospiraceae bacterium]|nr:hypothetical protein [Lachnospiraceae bacterium]